MGPLIFDFGFGFKNGVWIHSMQGLNLSLQLTMTSFKGRDSKPAAPSDGPAPLPEDADIDGEAVEGSESNGESSEEPTQDAETDSDESLTGEEKQ